MPPRAGRHEKAFNCEPLSARCLSCPIALNSSVARLASFRWSTIRERDVVKPLAWAVD